MRLEGKNAIVTGGGRGIGREIGRRFAAEGAHLLLADIDGDHARAAAEEIVAAGGQAAPCTADLGLPAGAAHLFETAAALLRQPPSTSSSTTPASPITAPSSTSRSRIGSACCATT